MKDKCNHINITENFHDRVGAHHHLSQNLRKHVITYRIHFCIVVVRWVRAATEERVTKWTELQINMVKLELLPLSELFDKESQRPGVQQKAEWGPGGREGFRGEAVQAKACRRQRVDQEELTRSSSLK